MSCSSAVGVHDPLLDHDEVVGLPQRPRWFSRTRPIIDNARQFLASNLGLLLVVISDAFFSLINVCVKQLSVDDQISTFEVLIVRMGITYICSLAYLLAARIDDPILGPKEARPLLILRGVSGFFGLFGIYYSLRYLSLSDATVLTFLAPLCTAISGALFLKESFRLTQALAGIVSLTGVILIARPPFLFGELDDHGTAISSGATVGIGMPTERMIAVGVALLGVLGATASYVSIRAIGRRAHVMHITSYFSLFCGIVAAIAMVVTRTPFIIPSRLNFVLLIMICILGFAGQIFLTMGLQIESAGRASMGIYTQIVFATIFQRIFFHTTPPLLSIMGTLLILSSALYVALTKPKLTQGSVELRPDDPDHMETALRAAHVKNPTP